jgi:hypothetical protein
MNINLKKTWWLRFTLFTLAWIGTDIILFFMNDPYHNDEGAGIGSFLGLVNFPIGGLTYFFIDKK